MKNYLLVMEYANGGSLRSYLKKNFSKLTWNDKYNLAYQLACAVSCLHDEGIIHRDLVFYYLIIVLLIISYIIYIIIHIIRFFKKNKLALWQCVDSSKYYKISRFWFVEEN